MFWVQNLFKSAPEKIQWLEFMLIMDFLEISWKDEKTDKLEMIGKRVGEDLEKILYKGNQNFHMHFSSHFITWVSWFFPTITILIVIYSSPLGKKEEKKKNEQDMFSTAVIFISHCLQINISYVFNWRICTFHQWLWIQTFYILTTVCMIYSLFVNITTL